MDSISVHAHSSGKQGNCQARVIEEELEGFVRVYKDGSVERFSYVVGEVAASNGAHQAVASKDVLVNAHAGVWARLYLPQSPLKTHKLPLLLYFHGGGFVIGSAVLEIKVNL